MNNLIKQDHTQRELALDPTQSFIVQAPAGSGKTELLIQRFLTLLANVNTPEEILVITFTKKAANEMRERIIKALKEGHSLSPPTSPHAKKTWELATAVLKKDKQFQWNVMNNPNQLRIQTIDSFCSYLTKQLPILSHFGAAPAIVKNPLFLYQKAVEEVLLHLEENEEWSNALSDLLLHLDNDLNKLQDLLVTLLAKREQWLPHIQYHSSEKGIREQLEHYLSCVIQEKLEHVAALFPQPLISELMAIIRFASDHIALNNPSSEILACRNNLLLPEAKTEHLSAWLGIAKCLLTKDFSWRKRVDKDIGFPTLDSLRHPQEKALHKEYRQRFADLIKALNEYNELRLALADLFILPDAHYQDSQWTILQSLLHVLKIVAAQLRVVFQTEGQIDFIENAQAALLALGDHDHPTDLALALDYQIRHILVDEFQDTSFTQYQLIEKLTHGWEMQDGRTLFVVGDPMQSIYRFREAEVGLFIRMRQYGIGHLQLTPITLSVNFRSTATIVEWNNQHFSRIFPVNNEIATGAVHYTPSIANQSQLNEHSITHIHGFDANNNERQAMQIASLIVETKNKHPDEKIAILLRSRTHLGALIPALKKANIPYRAVDIDPLPSRQMIQDLLSLTCALLHPADRIAWLAILRAPWCGLSLADLHQLTHQHPYQTIWELLENETICQQLSREGKQRIDRVYPVLKSSILARGRDHLRFWIENTWLMLGGPACLKNETDLDDANAFFKAIEEFDQDHPIIQIDQLKEKINQLYASSAHEESVQIMTIHSAKGLEFDTVILPHLERRNANDHPSLLLWLEQPLQNDHIALLLAPIQAVGDTENKTYRYIQRQQKLKSDYETDRLLYVATTRAIKRLHLFFNAEKKENDRYRIDSSSFLYKLWPFIEKKTDEIIHSNFAENASNSLVPEKYLYRLHATWENCFIEPQQIDHAYHYRQNGFQLRMESAKIIGIITHRILQKLAQVGMEWWTHKDSHQQNRYLLTQLKQAGINESDITPALQSIHLAISNTLHDERGQWILYAHQEAKTEYALSAMIDNKVENIIIDRMFVDENNVRWIIDYKTASTPKQDKETFLKQEKETYRKQMEKYRNVIQLRENRLIRLGLYFPIFSGWIEM